MMQTDVKPDHHALGNSMNGMFGQQHDDPGSIVHRIVSAKERECAVIHIGENISWKDKTAYLVGMFPLKAHFYGSSW